MDAALSTLPKTRARALRIHHRVAAHLGYDEVANEEAQHSTWPARRPTMNGSRRLWVQRSEAECPARAQ
jgi:hypothetical protein